VPIADGLIRVALDARSINQVHLRGMGRCVWELVARGRARHDVHWELFTDRPDLPIHLPPVEGLNVHAFEVRGYRFHSWEQFACPYRARKLGVDLMHGPSTTVPWWQPVPTVVTLHDTIPWQGNEPGWPRGWFVDRLLPRAYRKCAAIITISEASKRDIIRLWPELEAKLHVISNGVGDVYLNMQPAPLSDSLRSIGVKEPYLLYVGGNIPRKRLQWAIRVIEQMSDPLLTFVICGVESSAQAEIREQIRGHMRDRVCFAPFVAETDLPRLYQNAVAVLYPTLYEGFGLPVVEAQAVGTPVLFSALGSLAELEGPASFVLPSDDLTAWTATCRNLVRQRQSPSPDEQARVWARKYSWDTTADRTLEVYAKVIDRYRKPAGKTALPVSRLDAPVRSSERAIHHEHGH
jgi:glycosyltransferase involved in cell wall biosynthesis